MAVILGVVTGSIIATSLIFVTKQQSIKKKKVITPKITPTIAELKKGASELKINSPKDGFKTSKKTATIKGSADKNSLVVVQSHLTEKIIEIEKRDFSVEVPLSLGTNSIKVTAHNGTNLEEKNITIYYISE